MTADAQTLAVPFTGTPSASRRRWIESAGFDSGFFAFSPFAVLPLVFLTAVVSPRFALLFFLLAFPHYVSTFAFFFWDEYRDRYATRWFAFFAGPVLIAVAYWTLVYFQVPRIIQIVLFSWNIFHVSRQSCGILSIYRLRAGVFDVRSKVATNAAIIAGSFFLAFWNIETHPQFGPALAELSPLAAPMVKIALGAVALAGGIALATSLFERKRAGRAPARPEWLFLFASIAIFHPYLWMRNSGIATAVMLLPHYLQYLGLVWLLHRRKFRERIGSTPQQIVQRLSANAGLLVTCIVGVGMSFAVAESVLRHSGHASVFENIYLLLAFEHFYLDGLIWAFRDPKVRSSIGPWLTRYEPNAPANIAATVG